MIFNFQTFLASLWFMGALIASAPVWAGDVGQDIAARVNEANESLRRGDIDTAIGAYEEAQKLGPQRSDLSFNLAVAHYRQGAMAAAESLFKSVAAAEDNALAAKARFNLGNCRYASALQIAEKDGATAINQLESAIAHYRSALAIEPTDEDARANVELAAKLIERLKDQQQQQQQQDQQQEQQSGQENQQHEQPQSADGGENEQARSAQDQPKGGQQAAENKESSAQQSESQPQTPEPESQSTAQANQQESETSRNSNNQPSQQPRQDQSTNETAAQEKPGQAEEERREQSDTPPQGELSAADQGDKEQSDGTRHQVAAFDPSKDGELTEEEARKMLQAIRDRDMIRRLRRQAAERQRHVPVERDW